MSYLLIVFGLFLVWPINWPIYGKGAWWLLILFVLLCYAALCVAFVFGVRGRGLAGTGIPVRKIMLIGAIGSVALLVPLSFLYTGRGPWEVMSALADQTETYLRGVEQAFARNRGGRIASLVSALMGPFIFAVIPLGVLHWQRLTPLFRAGVVATALSSIVLSIMRGTDRELATSLIVAGSAFLITIGRGARSSAMPLQWLRRNWKIVAVLAIGVYFAAGAFTSRKADRLGTIESACTLRRTICADQDAAVIGWMDERSKFGISFFILTVTQGFYGLELGLEKDFKSTWGFGHSPVLLSIYTNLTGDDTPYERAYTTRNNFQGWSDRNYWSSMLLWVANDVGFLGTIAVIGLLGFIWGRSWRDAVYGMNDSAAILFCLIMVMLFYLPANNQVFATLDGYTSFYGWLFVWQLNKIKAASARKA